jgi:hypothetical protein
VSSVQPAQSVDQSAHIDLTVRDGNTHPDAPSDPNAAAAIATAASTTAPPAEIEPTKSPSASETAKKELAAKMVALVAAVLVVWAVSAAMQATMFKLCEDNPQSVVCYDGTGKEISQEDSVNACIVRISSGVVPCYFMNGEQLKKIARKIANERSETLVKLYTPNNSDPVPEKITLVSSMLSIFFSAVAKIGFAATAVIGSVFGLTITGALVVGPGLFVVIAVALVMVFVLGVFGEILSQVLAPPRA